MLIPDHKCLFNRTPRHNQSMFFQGFVDGDAKSGARPHFRCVLTHSRRRTRRHLFSVRTQLDSRSTPTRLTNGHSDRSYNNEFILNKIPLDLKSELSKVWLFLDRSWILCSSSFSLVKVLGSKFEITNLPTKSSKMLDNSEFHFKPNFE